MLGEVWRGWVGLVDLARECMRLVRKAEVWMGLGEVEEGWEKLYAIGWG